MIVGDHDWKANIMRSGELNAYTNVAVIARVDSNDCDESVFRRR